MEEQISPSKALHVAKMKARFADTIIKVQKTLQLSVFFSLLSFVMFVSSVTEIKRNFIYL